MAKQHNIRNAWVSALEMMTKNPAVMMPFVFIAFFESLLLELICFSTRSPLSVVANPIVRKFFGEAAIHYPGNMVLLPELFYYGQITIYILLGVFLTAVSVNMFKNIKEGLPVRANALIKNALRNYFSFLIYGIIAVALIFLLQRANTFVFYKFFRLLARSVHYVLPEQMFSQCLTISLFLTNIILQVFLVLTVPLMVMEKMSLLKAIWKSVSIGFRRFFTIFGIIFLPFLAYLPVTLLKNFSSNLASKTFPEINVYAVALGIVIFVFLDCFVIVSASQWLLNNYSRSGKGRQ